MGRLELRIKNPEARIVDARMPHRKASNEYPPSIVTAGGNRHLFIGSAMSYAYEIPADTHILKQPECHMESEEIFTIGGFDHMIRSSMLNFRCNYDRREWYWKKNYCGTFSVDVMESDANHPEWVFAITHCENKNEAVRTGYMDCFFHNSIDLNTPATEETSSGMKTVGNERRYRDYQPAYFGFVTMAYAPITEGTRWGVELFHHDMGPIIWPQSGFLTSDGKSKNPGYKNPHPHPSSLIAEDPKDGKKYLYVFANISSTNPEANTMVGACRSPIAERGRPGTYLNFYKGDYTEPSLPQDMSEELDVLLTRRGGRADALHPTLYNINRFFVARLKRSGLFLSVESYRAGDYLETALRLSRDLRTWTDRFIVPNTQVKSAQRRIVPGLYYPKFMSLDGSTHYGIDESEPFYIIGTKPHQLTYRELEIEIL